MEQFSDPMTWVIIMLAVLAWTVGSGVSRIVAALHQVRDQVASVEKTVIYCLSEEDRSDGKVVERIRDAIYSIGRKVAPNAGF